MLFKWHDVSGKPHQKQQKGKLLLKFHIALCFFLSFPSLADQLFQLDIPAQPADQALILLAKETDKTIIFSYDLTKQYSVKALKGYYSFEHALTKLLRGTGLKANIGKDNEISIIAVENSTIEAPTTERITKQNSKQNSTETAENAVEKIAIVGSRDIARSIHELPVPVDILSSEMLTATGQSETGRMLQTIAPSFNFASSSISDGTDVLKPATLRGLGPDQTLILVNGKRRHHASLIHINTSVGRGTAGADLNSIPIEAIKRIEILRDGAAAQYGSDAIAGVINIVLKDSPSEGFADSSFGQYTHGDGETSKIGINKGFAFGTSGFFNVTANYQDHQSTDRSGLHGTCQFSGCITLDNGFLLASDPRELEANRKTFEIGDPAYHQYSIAYNASYPMLEGELYSFSIYSHRENDSAAFFRHNNNNKANPKLQDGDAVIPQGYLPFIHSKIIDSSFSLGYRVETAKDIYIDLSYTQGSNKIAYTTTNSINPSYADRLRYQEHLSAEQIREQIPRSAYAYDLNLSLQTLNIDLQHMYDYLTFSLGMEFRRDKYQVGAGEEYSYFTYYGNGSNQLTHTNSLGGIQGFPGISPEATVNESRDVASIYGEVNGELGDAFYFSSAIRYDNYDGFGDTSNIKLAASWQLTDWAKLRGSISTGFRAPSMQQLYFNNLSTQFIVNENNQLVAEQIGTFRNDSFLAESIGIPELKEEQSTNLSLGGVFNFSNNFGLTIDYYAIDIDDRIVISNKLCPDFSPVLAQAIYQENVDKAQIFLNGANTETRGLDLIATWQDSVYQGQLELTLAANFTETEVTSLYSPDDSILHTLDVNQVFAKQDISIIEEWQPQDRISLSSLYQQNNWSLALAFNRYGKYTITDGDRQTYSDKLLTDIRFEQQLNKQFSWYTGVNNVFNVMPDKNKIGNSHAGTIVDDQGNVIVSSQGVFKYSRRSAPFGFNGSYAYLGINYHF